MAGKRHEPTPETRRLVKAMSSVGVPHTLIASKVGSGIDDVTLRKHYREEIDQGRAEACAKIGKKLFDRAMAGDTSALIWWTKAQMGWKETQVVEPATGKEVLELADFYGSVKRKGKAQAEPVEPGT